MSLDHSKTMYKHFIHHKIVANFIIQMHENRAIGKRKEKKEETEKEQLHIDVVALLLDKSTQFHTQPEQFYIMTVKKKNTQSELVKTQLRHCLLQCNNRVNVLEYT